MASTSLKYRYHDSLLESHRVGPQRELILEIRLDPVWNPGAQQNVRLRFGAIENLDEVRSFFHQTAGRMKAGAFERVERIALLEKGKWVVELDSRGTVMISTSKIPQEQ